MAECKTYKNVEEMMQALGFPEEEIEAVKELPFIDKDAPANFEEIDATINNEE